MEIINKSKEIELTKIESEKEAMTDQKQMHFLDGGAIVFAITLIIYLFPRLIDLRGN